MVRLLRCWRHALLSGQLIAPAQSLLFFFFKAKNKRLKEKKSEFLKNPNYNDTRILDVIDQLPTHRLLLKGVAFPVNRLA